MAILTVSHRGIVRSDSIRILDKPFVKLLYSALAADDRQIWVDWEVRIQCNSPLLYTSVIAWRHLT